MGGIRTTAQKKVKHGTTQTDNSPTFPLTSVIVTWPAKPGEVLDLQATQFLRRPTILMKSDVEPCRHEGTMVAPAAFLLSVCLGLITSSARGCLACLVQRFRCEYGRHRHYQLLCGLGN